MMRFEDIWRRLIQSPAPAVAVAERPALPSPALDEIKGQSLRIFTNQQANALSDTVLDVRKYNAVHVEVFVRGTNPSAVLAVQGATDSENYVTLPDGQATQTVTANTTFRVEVGAHRVKVDLSSISGTFAAGQGFTVILTPYRSAGSTAVTLPNLEQAEDAAHASGDSGVQLLAVRKDTPAALAGADGDYAPLEVDASGRLHVAPLVTGDNNIGKVGIDQTTPGTTNNVTVGNIEATDDGGVTLGTQKIVPMGMLADETSPDSVDEGDVGIPRMTLSRIPWAALRAKASASADTELEALSSGGHVLLKAVLYDADGTAYDVSVPGDGAAGGATLRAMVYPEVFNGSNYDRARSIASSGAGLGVQQVGTLGELITLAASAARTESANGTAVTGLGWRNRYILLFDLTVADTDAGDTLDVYVDVSLEGTTWLNAVHFTQIIGTDSASKRFAVLDPSAPGTSEILVTSDAAAGVVRPSLFGAQMRARWAIVDAGTDDASFTFSVSAYAI